MFAKKVSQKEYDEMAEKYLLYETEYNNEKLRADNLEAKVRELEERIRELTEKGIVQPGLINKYNSLEAEYRTLVEANEKLIALNKGEAVKNMKDANVSRTEGAPLVVLNAVFAGKTGENTIAEGTDAFYVLTVGKNTMPAQDKAKKEALRKELEKMSVHFVQDDYTRFLKQEYPVKINERNYEKFIAK